MKNVKNMLSNLGIILCTGMSAMMGMALGIIAFTDNKIKLTSNNDN